MLRQIYVAITKLSLRLVGDNSEWHQQESLLLYFYLFIDVLVNIQVLVSVILITGILSVNSNSQLLNEN